MNIRGMGTFVCCLGILLGFPEASLAQSSIGSVSLTVAKAPPKIPAYDLPPQPDQSHVWVPGYWAFNPEVRDYFWVPGFWALPPGAGMLWTPGYWGWRGNSYFYYVGFWGPAVGFYGGINYGHGYGSEGYTGGTWKDDKFYPNVPKKAKAGGGPAFNCPLGPSKKAQLDGEKNQHECSNGVVKRPSESDLEAAQKKGRGATKDQLKQEREAKQFEGNLATKNAGIPKVAATLRVGDFSKGVIPALPIP